jgi:hypothetical protein
MKINKEIDLVALQQAVFGLSATKAELSPEYRLIMEC